MAFHEVLVLLQPLRGGRGPWIARRYMRSNSKPIACTCFGGGAWGRMPPDVSSLIESCRTFTYARSCSRLAHVGWEPYSDRPRTRPPSTDSWSCHRSRQPRSLYPRRCVGSVRPVPEYVLASCIRCCRKSSHRRCSLASCASLCGGGLLGAQRFLHPSTAPVSRRRCMPSDRRVPRTFPMIKSRPLRSATLNQGFLEVGGSRRERRRAVRDSSETRVARELQLKGRRAVIIVVRVPIADVNRVPAGLVQRQPSRPEHRHTTPRR